MARGEKALSASCPLGVAAAIVLPLCMALSLFHSAVFLAVVAVALQRGRAIVLVKGSARGLVLWVVNLHLFAPLFYPWLAENYRPIVEIADRVLFFGLQVGLVVSRALPNSGPIDSRNATSNSDRYVNPT
jgi:ABC-type transport system involved in cytochrome c biogenesis permease subunit